jgi:hypothetical protein
MRSMERIFFPLIWISACNRHITYVNALSLQTCGLRFKQTGSVVCWLRAEQNYRLRGVGGECVCRPHPSPLPLFKSHRRTTSSSFQSLCLLACLPALARRLWFSLQQTSSDITGVDTLNSWDVANPVLLSSSPPTHGKMLHEVDCVHCRRLLYNSTYMHMSRLGKRGCTALVLYCTVEDNSGRACDRQIGELALVGLLGSRSRLESYVSKRICSICTCMHPCMSACCGKASLCERTWFSTKLCRVPAAGGLYGRLASARTEEQQLRCA